MGSVSSVPSWTSVVLWGWTWSMAVAVVAEVGDEVGVDLELEETGAEGGLGGFLFGVSPPSAMGESLSSSSLSRPPHGRDVFFDAVGDLL